jgi:membrane-bound serine protease (ClpP class)
MLVVPSVSARPVAQVPPATGPIYAIEIQNTLTTATISYVRRALRVASAANAQALIITLSSGGGIIREIRPLAAEIVQSPIPVIVLIGPAGTQAGAPGAFLASAAHISAMTPGSSFGSPYPLTSVDAALSQQSQAIISDSIADQLRDWNRARGRNLAWVEQAVQSGVILTNEQAIATNPPAIDLVAVDQQQLLLLLDGRMVQMASGSSVQLATLGRNVMPIAPTLTETAWQLLAEPNTAFALLVLGVLAIYLEFAAPGTTFFAGIGVVMVIGAAIGLFALPIQGWAIGLIILALILLGLEFVVVSHGGFTVAGLILLAVAGLNLIDPLQAPGASVAPSAVAVVVLGLAGVVGAGIGLALRTRSQPIATGSEALVGRLAEVRQRLDPQGMVFIDGALWQAICEEGAAEPGDWVRVQAVHRLRLIVRPIERTE